MIDSHLELRLRPSMHKFTSVSRNIEVASTFEQPLPYFTNGPFINICEDLGVTAEEYLKHQARDAEQARKDGRTLAGAAKLFRRTGGTSFHL